VSVLVWLCPQLVRRLTALNSNSVPALLFVKAPGGFINPSRINPSCISVQSTTVDGSRYIMMSSGAVATCVSSVMSTESRLVYGRSVGKSLPRKWLTGMFHNQEYERFSALVCMAFGVAVVYGQLSNGGVMFQTRLGPPIGTGEVSRSHMVRWWLICSLEVHLGILARVEWYRARKVSLQHR
jgi:hypothetical protein